MPSGYIRSQETSLYYLQSRYYNPEWGRFLNADAFVTTGQGFIGNNMFAYCLNNPISRKDCDGLASIAIGSKEIGDEFCTKDGGGSIGFALGVLALGIVAIVSEEDNFSEPSYAGSGSSPGLPSPDNDEDDDDYYNDDSNFGRREKIGKKKGNTPLSNQRQNKQFKDATKGLTKSQKRRIHDRVTGKGLDYHELGQAVKDLLIFAIGIFCLSE